MKFEITIDENLPAGLPAGLAVYFHRGLAYMKNKQYQEAAQDFTIILDVFPCAEVLYNRATCRLLNNTQEAKNE